MMKRLFALVFVVLVAAPVVFVTQAQAQVKIDITRGRVEPMPIAITTFAGSNDQSKQVGRDVSDVISKNLERSGLFRPLDPKGFIQEMTSLEVTPKTADGLCRFVPIARH